MNRLNTASLTAVTLATALTASHAAANNVAGNFKVYDNPTGLDFVGAPAGFNTFGSTADRGVISIGIVDDNVENFSINQIFLESGLSDFIGGNLELDYRTEDSTPLFSVDEVAAVPVPVNPEWNGSTLSLSAEQPLNETGDRLLLSFDLLGDLDTFDANIGDEGFRLAANLNGPDGDVGIITGPLFFNDGGNGNDGNNGGPNVIPTPSAALGGMALLGLAAVRRRRQSVG